MLPVVYLAVLLGLLMARTRRNPSAEEDSATFHGEPGEVHHLSAAERRMPKEAMVVGKAESITYRTPANSKRAGLYVHRFGDGGLFAPDSTERPLLVEKNGRINLIEGKSPARFSPRVGLLR